MSAETLKPHRRLNMNKKTSTVFVFIVALGLIIVVGCSAEDSNNIWGIYAGSGRSLNNFKNDYLEIKNDSSFLK